MSKTTITITDPMKVKAGDKAYFKNCDFGFTVTGVDPDDKDCPIAVYNPLSGEYYWILLSRFDHATREVDEPEWPHPEDLKLHVYIGADGANYLYMPEDESDKLPWRRFPSPQDYALLWMSEDNLATYYTNALPLTEVNLAPKEEEA